MSPLTSEDMIEDTSKLDTIQDWLRWTYSRLNENTLFFGHGSENSWDESVHLVLQALNLPWDFDQNYFHAHITKSEKAYLHTLVKKRIQDRIPVPYLLNLAWFCDLPFYVDTRVIIPRSPIAELIKKRMHPWVKDSDSITHILDLCCGSGCIGIAAAKQFPQAHVDLVDISSDALDVAKINIDNHDLWDRVTPIQSDLFEQLKHNKNRHPRYQLIIANPPYVSRQEINELPEEYHHEPTLALYASDNGLSIVINILKNAAEFLDANGLLIVEVGNSEWALQTRYPNIPFEWVEFENGGHGVFILSAETCNSLLNNHSKLSKQNPRKTLRH